MPDLNEPQPTPTADVVIRYRVAPMIYWVLFGAISAFMALIIVMAFQPDPRSPPMGWFDGIAYALVVVAGGVLRLGTLPHREDLADPRRRRERPARDPHTLRRAA